MTLGAARSSSSVSHQGYANYGVLYLTSLEAAGAWPKGERAVWVVMQRDEADTSYEMLARVLGVTRERVRQIYNQEKRRRDDATG